jgi:hypothetical protein
MAWMSFASPAPWLWVLAFLVCAVELSWYIYVKYVLYPRLLPLNKPPPPAMPPAIFIERVLQHILCLENYTPHDFFSGIQVC